MGWTAQASRPARECSGRSRGRRRRRRSDGNLLRARGRRSWISPPQRLASLRESSSSAMSLHYDFIPSSQRQSYPVWTGFFAPRIDYLLVEGREMREGPRGRAGWKMAGGFDAGPRGWCSPWASGACWSSSSPQHRHARLWLDRVRHAGITQIRPGLPSSVSARLDQILVAASILSVPAHTCAISFYLRTPAAAQAHDLAPGRPGARDSRRVFRATRASVEAGGTRAISGPTE